MELFILLWGVTLLLPFIHLYFPRRMGRVFSGTQRRRSITSPVSWATRCLLLSSSRFLMAPSSGLDWAGVGMIVAGYICHRRRISIQAWPRARSKKPRADVELYNAECRIHGCGDLPSVPEHSWGWR